MSTNQYEVEYKLLAYEFDQIFKKELSYYYCLFLNPITDKLFIQSFI